jgi:hypothetical protein
MSANRTTVEGHITLVTAGWALIALIEPDGGTGWWSYAAKGLLIGTMFGQTTIAGAWAALGPYPLLKRLPLSLVWIAVLLLAVAINMTLYDGPGADFIFLWGTCLYGQWLLIQAPLWALAIFGGLRLTHEGDARPPGRADRQFGIGQLIVFTTIVAVLLGIGRVIAQNLGFRTGGETPVFAFLAVAATVTTVPLPLAVLLKRRGLLALALALLLLAGFTFWELPLLKSMSPGGGPDFWHLAWINGTSAAWVLTIAGILRRGGYRLSSQRF